MTTWKTEPHFGGWVVRLASRRWAPVFSGPDSDPPDTTYSKEELDRAWLAVASGRAAPEVCWCDGPFSSRVGARLIGTGDTPEEAVESAIRPRTYRTRREAIEAVALQGGWGDFLPARAEKGSAGA